MGETGSSDSVLRQRVTGGSEGPKPSAAGAVPPARWTMNRKGVPHAVAHRGYKAEFPENTMGAFRGAVNVGASAIETDLHLSKDDVVVIAHVSLSNGILTHSHTHSTHGTRHTRTNP